MQSATHLGVRAFTAVFGIFSSLAFTGPARADKVIRFHKKKPTGDAT